jgi:hypothetical protein
MKDKSKTTKKRGRVSDYNKMEIKHKLPLITAWYRDGSTDKEVAKKLKIAIRTLYDWKLEYPAFNAATKKGKEISDIEVENALFKRAVGFDFKEETKERRKSKDENGEEKVELVVTKVITKHFPPEVGAQVFWLSNRKPEQWKNRQDKTITGKLSILDLLDDEEIKPEKE